MCNLSFTDSVTPTWQGLPLISSNHALDKMIGLGMRLYDVAVLLEYGNECGDKRKDGTYEICERWRGKEIKIILTQDYSRWVEDMAWIIITIIEKR